MTITVMVPSLPNNKLSMLPHSCHSAFHGHYQLLCGGGGEVVKRVNLYCRLLIAVCTWEVSCLVGRVPLAVVVTTVLLWRL